MVWVSMTPVHLAVEVFVFLAVVEHLCVIGIGKHFSTISEQDDFPAPIAQSSCSLVEVKIVVISALIIRLTSTGTSKLS